jgi:uncharacterized protein YndB with AHSA1/START domain
MAKRSTPHVFTGKVHNIDARIGGGCRMSFTNFSTGEGHWFGGSPTDPKPRERTCCINKLDDPGTPGEMKVTVTFGAVSRGTELEIFQEGLPAVIPVSRSVELAAERLGVSRSELFQRAVREFLRDHMDKGVSEAINDVYGEAGTESPLDPFLECVELAPLPESGW